MPRELTVGLPSAELVLVERRLPIPGRVQVMTGDCVQPDDVVAVAPISVGRRWVIPVATQLRVSPARFAEYLLVRPGEELERGAVLAAVPGATGRISLAPISGVVEQVIQTSGQIILTETAACLAMPVQIDALAELGCSRQQLPKLLQREGGALVRRGELLAGSFSGRCLLAPLTGRLQAINQRTGEIVILPVRQPYQLLGAVPGTVVSTSRDWGCTIQCDAITVRGEFRIGSEAFGRLQTMRARRGQAVEAMQLTPDLAGAILVLQSALTGEVLFRARALGVKGIVAGGMHLSELMQAIGAPQPARVGSADLVDLAVLLTAPFGSKAMEQQLFAGLEALAGKPAFLFSQRPELLISN